MAKSTQLIRMQESLKKVHEDTKRKVLASLGPFQITEPGDNEYTARDLLRNNPDFEKEEGYKPAKLYYIQKGGPDFVVGEVVEDTKGQFHARFHEGHGFMTEVYPRSASQVLNLVNWNSEKFR